MQAKPMKATGGSSDRGREKLKKNDLLQRGGNKGRVVAFEEPWVNTVGKKRKKSREKGACYKTKWRGFPGKKGTNGAQRERKKRGGASVKNQ